MMNTVSRDKISTRTITKFAGLLILAALAIAFFALPMSSLAMCTGKKATFQAFVSGVTPSSKNDGSISAYVTTTMKTNWVAVKLDTDGSLWAATLTSKVKNGKATGIEAIDGDGTKPGANLQIHGIQ